jgi:hypothetical protein
MTAAPSFQSDDAADPFDSSRVPLDLPHPMTNGERRDAQVRVLEALGAHLSAQMAELAIGQQAAVKDRAEFAKRVTLIETELAANTAVTHEVRDLLTAFKGGFRVLGWLGTGLKWVGGLATACVAIYTVGYMLTHGGNLPGGDK